jgi:hypothetical protein
VSALQQEILLCCIVLNKKKHTGNVNIIYENDELFGEKKYKQEASVIKQTALIIKPMIFVFLLTLHPQNFLPANAPTSINGIANKNASKTPENRLYTCEITDGTDNNHQYPYSQHLTA